MGEEIFILEELFQFWTFSDPASTWVLLGSVLLGATAGVAGCFTFLQKKSLIGDVLAHSALPGVTTAFLLFHSRGPLVIYLGAISSCLFAAFVFGFLQKKTRIKQDAIQAIILSVFFAVGVFQLTMIQKSPIAAQAGLENLLFGKAAAITLADLKVLSLVSILCLAFIFCFFQKLKILVFDPVYYNARGLGQSWLSAGLWLVLVVTIVTGLQLAGVVLVAALVLIPPAAARFWSKSLDRMLPLSALFGAVSGALGANVSFLIPAMPTGPWMVVIASMIFAVSCLFAPGNGFVSRYLGRKKLRRSIREENFLRTVFRLGGEVTEQLPLISSEQVAEIRGYDSSLAKSLMSSLGGQRMLSVEGSSCTLTEKGLERALELTRFHRLWELYLTEEISAAADHVHEDAEEVEHVMDAEIEKGLLESLKQPQLDPHGKPIPELKAGKNNDD